MAKPIYTPRVNNNDDFVQLVALKVAPGDKVACGDHLADVETDKSVLEVTAEHGGYVLEIRHQVDERAEVGSVLMWLGDSPDDPIPELAEEPAADASTGAGTGRPTARAASLLRKYGLAAEQVPATGDRLSASDVEAYARRKGLVTDLVRQSGPEEPRPGVPGSTETLSAEEQGMLNTVCWHRDHAAAAYLEIEYESAPWDAAAAEYAAAHRLLMAPLLPMMAYRLVELAIAQPKLNSTIVAEQRYRYDSVNLGFTVQAGDTLYLTVTRRADQMSMAEFIQSLGSIQRNAMAHRLKADETQGATISFTSMARWKVTRHMPILPPHSSIIVAHAATGADGKAVLGATYDHRVLSGADVVKVLRALAKPPVAL